MKSRHVPFAFLTFCLGLLSTVPAQARMDGPTTAGDQNMVMYLGNVEVRGQEKITRTLQAIKVALTMPYSDDPKLANMMVCRLEDKAGSHVQQILICGTNRILSKQRDAMQMHMTAAVMINSHGGPCTSIECYSGVFDELNETLDSMPGHYLKTTVDGSALRGLLQQVPVRAPDAPTAVAAPAAASRQ